MTKGWLSIRARGSAFVSVCVMGLIVLGGVYVFPSTASAATQVVTNCNDSGPGSLRQAVADAASGDTVGFALSPPCSTITLTSGDIEISTDLSIEAPGTASIAVNGDNSSQVFVVDSGAVATISGLIIEDGSGIADVGAGGGGIPTAEL